jgi:peptide/nickel transport system permease protein
VTGSAVTPDEELPPRDEIDGPAGLGGVAERALEVARRYVPARRRLSRKLLLGLAIVVFFVLAGIIGPFFAANPDTTGVSLLAPPSAAHWLGTDDVGRDVLAQLLTGDRNSLIVGFAAGALATAVSLLVGVTGGYLGGFADEGLSLFSNVVLVIPGLPLVILVSAYLKNAGLLSIAVVIAFTAWAGSARVLRAQTLSLRTRDYVDAARVSGESIPRIIASEIIPNLAPIIASQALLSVVYAILTEAGLAFLGLGSINTVTWGSMLYFAQNAQALDQGAWWWFVPPGLCIALFGAGLAFVNFGIDEILNPRLRHSRPPTSRRAARADRIARPPTAPLRHAGRGEGTGRAGAAS